MAEDYWEQRFIEENYMVEDLGKNPRPEWLDNLYAHHQMIKDYEWVVENLRKINSSTKSKRMKLNDHNSN